MVQKMMKFGANVTQTALKGWNLAPAGNYDHVLNLKYTCRALPSCLIFFSKAPQPRQSKQKSIISAFDDNNMY